MFAEPAGCSIDYPYDSRVPSMTPKEFAFTLTVPRDPRFVTIVRDVATQVVAYAAMDASHGSAFVDRVAAASERILAHAHNGQPCEVAFSCEHGEVHVTMADEIIRQRVAS
jgi:hypothetical protein